MRLNFFIPIFLLILFIVLSKQSISQQPILFSSSNDTIRIVHIIRANSLWQKTIDSVTTLESAAGNAIIKEGTTTIYCDSVVVNSRTHIAEAFGNVHINNNDSIHTYSQYLKYIGNDRIAYLKKSVKLTDKKGVLLTEDLVYDLRTGIATYKNGGRLTSDRTILTSTDGVYYANTKDVHFKNKVHLVDPKYDIKTDSLLYNANSNIAIFIAPTHIVSKDGIVDTKSGSYDLNTGAAIFNDRTVIKDSSRLIIANHITSDEKTGIVLADGNAKLVDSINQVTVFANNVELNKKDNSFLAYNKPVMIIHKDNDSTFISADTLFSGLRKDGIQQKKESAFSDTLKNTTRVNLNKSDTAIRYFLGFHHVKIFNDSVQSICDSLYYSTQDSTFQLFGKPIVWNAKTQITADTIYMFTQNQQPKRFYAFYNSLIINQTADQLFNQVGGRTLNGYFKNGNIDYVRVKGSPAESIFYPQDEKDSSFTGMNRSSGDVIDIYFVNKELNNIKFVNNVDGVMYPIRQIPTDKKRLKNFNWLDAKRPKNKLELFE